MQIYTTSSMLPLDELTCDRCDTICSTWDGIQAATRNCSGPMLVSDINAGFIAASLGTNYGRADREIPPPITDRSVQAGVLRTEPFQGQVGTADDLHHARDSPVSSRLAMGEPTARCRRLHQKCWNHGDELSSDKHKLGR